MRGARVEKIWHVGTLGMLDRLDELLVPEIDPEQVCQGFSACLRRWSTPCSRAVVAGWRRFQLGARLRAEHRIGCRERPRHSSKQCDCVVAVLRGSLHATAGAKSPGLTVCGWGGDGKARRRAHSARKSSAVGVPAAIRPGMAATTLARMRVLTTMSVTVRAGMIGAGTAWMS